MFKQETYQGINDNEIVELVMTDANADAMFVEIFIPLNIRLFNVSYYHLIYFVCENRLDQGSGHFATKC